MSPGSRVWTEDDGKGVNLLTCCQVDNSPMCFHTGYQGVGRLILTGWQQWWMMGSSEKGRKSRDQLPTQNSQPSAAHKAQTWVENE